MKKVLYLTFITGAALCLSGAGIIFVSPSTNAAFGPGFGYPSVAVSLTGASSGKLRETRNGQPAYIYPADLKGGNIGITALNPVDDPYDNIFHFYLDKAPDAGDEVWLTYELTGVQDHSAVTRGINGRQSVGGCLVKQCMEQSVQRERINATWLRKGDNVVRFSLPEGATYGYRINGIRLEVEKNNGQSGLARDLIVGQPYLYRYGNSVYVKGFLTGAGAARVFVDTTEIPVVAGEYEYLLNDLPETACTLKISAVYSDGQVIAKTLAIKAAAALPDWVNPLTGKGLSRTAFFQAGKAGSLEGFGAALQIPDGALENDITLSVTALRDVDLPPLPPDMVNVTQVHKGYRFLPDGLQFIKAAKIHLPLDTTLIPAGFDVSDVRTWFFDETGRRWKMLRPDTLQAGLQTLISETSHFTDFINGIIKVPESPQTQGYKQTEIKDIKANNAFTGISMIAPPAGNPMGSANLQFPIKVPAGRAGLQPALNIQYNSEGGNDWLGLGWDLSGPSITVDTRWGVPRYDPVLETETYLMGGGMLSPNAHRDALTARQGNEKRFRPRVENAYDKIIRHGNTPKNYYWEVVNKNGVRHFYGGTAAGIDASSVLTDNDGNVAQWRLREVRDANGNFMRYNYITISDPGLPGGKEPGKNIYLQEIRYTGYGAEEGKYKVRFIRDRDLNDPRRLDVQINGRLGFKQVTADLLRRIEITFNGNIVRSYELIYDEGAFYKSLLSVLIEYDQNNQEFYRHTFDYYDEVRKNDNYHPFSGDTIWNVPYDTITGGLINPIPGFGDDLSVLGGSGSSQYGFGGSFLIGLPFDCGTKNLSIGVNYNFSESESEGRIAFLDINGDNLPDKVFRKNNALWFERNLSADGTKGFGPMTKIQNITAFSKSETRSHSIGVEANFYAFVGRTSTKTKTKTDVYFADFNGDGLIDLANRGTVWFNHTDADGNPVFTTDSEDTPNKILNGAPIDTSILAFDPMEQEELIDQNPLHDVVRMWRPPYPGFVRIQGGVQLINDQSDNAQNYDRKDSVIVKIEHKGAVKWRQKIEHGDFTFYPLQNLGMQVDTGDHIYFRLQSGFDGAFDKVIWNPEITYETINLPNVQPNEHDANDKPVHRYLASEDFLLSAAQTFTMPYTGKAWIKSIFNKPDSTSDNIEMAVEKMSEQGGSSTLLSRLLKWDTIATIQIDTLIDVVAGEDVIFKVKSQTNIDWKAISFTPAGYYDVAVDTAGDPVTVKNAMGEPLQIFCPAPEYTMFNYVVKKTEPFVPTADGLIQVFPEIRFAFPSQIPDAPVSGDITLSIKGINKLYAKTTFTAYNDSIPDVFTQNFPLQAQIPAGEPVFIEYHIKSRGQADSIGKDHLFTKTKFNNVDIGIQVGLFTTLIEREFIFGHLYRGWGQFAYNGNRNRADMPINEADLKIDPNLKNKVPSKSELEALKDPNNVSFPYDPAKENFILMAPDIKTGQWLGNDRFTWIGADSMSSSRFGDDDILLVDLPATGGNNLSAPRKVSLAQSTTWAGGGSISVVGATYTHSENTSITDVEVMDLTGDRYPEIIGPKYFQYTNALGGREPDKIMHDLGVHVSKSASNGGSASGSFPTAKNDNSGTPGKGAPSIKIQVSANANGVSCKAAQAPETAKNTVSLSGNATFSEDHTENTWLDINADGLPDMVYADGEVRLNLGYAFGEKEKWGDFAIREGNSLDIGAGLGYNWANMSFSGGVSLSRTENEVTKALQDVNGDGLPDIIVVENPLKVRLNTGAGFAPPIPWYGVGALDQGFSTGESINGSFTFCIHFFAGFIPIFKICVNPSGSFGQGASTELRQLTDVDGDGFADMLRSGKDGELFVNASTIGRTNLLKSVLRPFGSSFTIAYNRTNNTYEMPNSKWVMNGVEVNDGLPGDGADLAHTTFAYENGRYNRRERDFYGFNKVVTRQLDTQNNNAVYRTTTQTFNNSNYYEKGRLEHEILQDGEGNKYVETINQYELRNAVTGLAFDTNTEDGSAFNALLQTEKLYYEGQTTAGLTNKIAYVYDAVANITQYTDFGDGTSGDILIATISYHNLDAPYIKSVPKSIEVKDQNGRIRYREADIDSRGNVTKIRQFLENGDAAVFDMAYEPNGNLKKLTKPENHNKQRLYYEYTYDPEVQTYVTSVKDAYGYESQSDYDYAFGQAVETRDINNQRILYSLDAKGRIDTITGPYELAAGRPYTILFEYYPDAAVPYGVTKHFDPATGGDIQTLTFMDGLQRPVQVKKTGALFVDRNSPDQTVMIVSGRVVFDAFGRTVESYYPVTEPIGSNNYTLDTIFDPANPTKTTFDVLDRPITHTLPDQAITFTQYAIEKDNSNYVCFKTTVTDPLGNSKENYNDLRGRTRAVRDDGPNGEIWTDFRYNVLGELLQSTDQGSNQTTYKYDHLGRRLHINHPDAGLTILKYDLAGNLLEKETPNTRADSGAIRYTFEFERLVQVDYPKNYQNMVRYSYGKAGDPHNRAGRVWLQEDATGGQEFFYGPLGEVRKNIRTVLVNQNRLITYVSEYRYDTWGRIDSMMYPDKEVVKYRYNAAGKLSSVTGQLGSHTYPYASRIGYDKFEQRAYLRHGNNTETFYTYDPERRRLASMMASDAASRPFMSNTYTYDAVSNILSIRNTAPVVNNVPGGPATHNYAYDKLYRLAEANGTCMGQVSTETYTLKMTYDDLHNITRKQQTHLRDGLAQPANSYDQHYTFDPDRPHIPVRIRNKVYRADNNGNLTGWTEDLSNKNRFTYWDEENRIKAIWENGYLSQYTYDAGGERVIKSHGGLQVVYTNGEPKGMINHRENFTVYVSPYLVARDKQLTKHIYIEGQRIVSKIGAGDIQYVVQGFPGEYLTAGNVNYNTRMKLLADANNSGNPAPATPSNPAPPSSGLHLYQPGQVNYYAYAHNAYNNDNAPAGFNAVEGRDKEFEGNQYFFHPDHLGSTAYVTDANGKVRQHVEYLPFGEIFVEEHLNNDPLQPYLYNAKEYDAETGLYYYGARYYDPKLSIWLSVDPLAEKYPGWSPYNYTLLNPVKYVDPDGKQTAQKQKDGALLDNINLREVYENTTKNLDSWSNAISLLQNNLNPIIGSSKEIKGIKDILSATDKDLINGWRALNGKVYDMNFSGGTRGNLGSRIDVLGKANTLGKLGNVLGVVSTSISGALTLDAMMRGDQLGATENGINTLFGIIGYAGPVGAAFSNAYSFTGMIDNYTGFTDYLSKSWYQAITGDYTKEVPLK